MSKIIKRKIKRSIPALFVLFMVGSIVSATVFNFNFLLEIPKNLGDKIKVSFSEPVANAGQTATTSVTVKNAPPAWASYPIFWPGGVSTTPVNIGENTSATSTGNDPEDNNYFLIICSTNSVTPHNSAPPTCGGTTYCVSASTTDTGVATCNYNNVASTSEQTTYYAFLCDDNYSDADCSTPYIGTLFVNHRPIIHSVSTTVNNRDPGQQVTLTATTSDPNIVGEYDRILVDFCTTNSWSVSTGCTATTLCSASSTYAGTPLALSCNYTLASVLADQAYTYYAFVKDWHNLAASPNGSSSTYTVNNVSPQIGAGTVYLNGGNNIIPNVKNSPAAIASSSSVSVTDNNGCADLVGATSTIYRSGVSGGPNCSHDPDNCYQITSVNCVKTDCSGPSDPTVTYICSTTVAFHIDPTDNSTNNSRAAQNWLTRLTVYDEAISTSSVSNGVEVISVTALDVSENVIPYNVVRSSFDTGSTNATSTINIFGNTPLKVDLYGSNMICTTGICSGNNIAINQQEFKALVNFVYGNGTKATSTPGTYITDINLPNKPTTTSQNLYNPVYWGIQIPAGKPSGDYYGSNTFGAVIDGDASW